MNRGVVFLGLVIAVGAGWATEEFFPRGLMRLVDPLFGTMWRRTFGRDLRELKRQMEAGEL